jgi:hypothetical protein
LTGLEKATPPLILRNSLFIYSKNPLKNHCTFCSILQKPNMLGNRTRYGVSRFSFSIPLIVGSSVRAVVDVVVVFIVSIQIGGQARLIAKLDVVRLDIDKLIHRVLAQAVALLGVDKSLRREIALGRRARPYHAEDLLGQLLK